MGVIAIVGVVGGRDHKLAGRPQAAVLIPQFTKIHTFTTQKKGKCGFCVDRTFL